MDWDVPYVVSRSLTFEILRTGRFAATSSISRPAQEMELDALPVLMAFAAGATPREALVSLQAEWELDEEGFATVAAALIDQAFLVPAGQKSAVSLAQEGFASVISHHHLLQDTVRVMAYQAAIARHSRGCSVVEVGCGSGILSIFAARAGARRVVAIEESEIAALAERMFQANGCDGIVELRRANSRDVELDEPADLLIHEILGTDPFSENLLPAIFDARERLLRPGGRLLPWRIQVLCIGIEAETRPHRDREYFLAEAAEAQRLYGVDMSPLVEILAAVDSRQLVPPFEDGDPRIFKPKVLSEECLLRDVDLRTDGLDRAGEPSEALLRIQSPGTLGAIVVYFRAHLDEDIQLANAPFAPLTSWGRNVRLLSRPLAVAPGDEVRLRVELKSWRGRQMLDVDLA
ncbi:MAG TPA: 50S ribosomal protein L11 methyltransferase [Thermoanaerobaculia bacterium]|nr:50S ribosomal protein L11 methyltransferase [Thermoanaerobaculia bacterium]